MEARAREVTYETHDLGSRVDARPRGHAGRGADARERRSRVRRPAAVRARRRRRGPAVRVLSTRGRGRAAPVLLPAPAAAAVRAARVRGALPSSAPLGRRVLRRPRVGRAAEREARTPPLFVPGLSILRRCGCLATTSFPPIG